MTYDIQRLAVSIFAVASTCLFSSCQKTIPNKMMSPAKVEVLNGKSAGEVLQKKYARAVLRCELYIQHSAEFSKSNPNDHFSIDLLDAKGRVEVVQLTGSADGLSVTTKIALQALVNQNLQVDDSRGNTYRLQNSPTMPVEFEIEETFLTDDGSTSRSETSISATIVEKIVVTPLKLTRTIGNDGVAFHELIECLLTTDIKPEYGDQFKTVKLSSSKP